MSLVPLCEALSVSVRVTFVITVSEATRPSFDQLWMLIVVLSERRLNLRRVFSEFDARPIFEHTLQYSIANSTVP